MNKTSEETFVKKFTEREKRDRLIYELFSKKKRENAIQNIFYALDERYCVLHDNKITDEKLLEAAKKYVGENQDCYVIADGEDDGKILPFKTAFQNLTRTAGMYYIICENKTVLAKEEVFDCAPCKKLLFRE